MSVQRISDVVVVRRSEQRDVVKIVTRGLQGPPGAGGALPAGSGYLHVTGGVMDPVVPAIPASDITQDSTHRFASDTEKATWNAKQAALGFTPEDSSNKGAAGGYAPLDGSSKVPAAYLPSYVDDVLEYANFAALPGTGETGKIYVTLDANEEYRWSGSAYIKLTASPGSTDAVPEGTTNLYFTVARVRATLLAGIDLTVNAAITAADSVLGAFGKLQKQITDLAASLSGYVPTSRTVNGHALSADVTVTKSDVSLGNVDNTSDVNKPVSTAQAAADAAVQAYAIQRANHTGTQLAATISDFSSAADARISAAIGSSVQAYDSDLAAIAALSTTPYGRAFLALVDASAGRTALGLGSAALSASTDFDVAGAAAAAQAASQPLDSDLTAIAALTTTPFGRALLVLADAAALRTAAALGTVATLASDVDGTLAANSDARVPTQKAAKTYIDTAIAALVASAPGTLDTLKELADAIGDDPNFATTLTTLVGTKLAKASNLSDLTSATTALDNLGLTANGKSLVTALNYAAMRTLLGLVIGTDVQAHSTALDNVTNTNSGDQLTFKTVSVSGQSDVVADTTTDTLMLVAGSGVTITTDASTDTITIAASASGTAIGLVLALPAALP